MELSTIIILAAVSLIVLLLIVAYRLLWTVIWPKVKHRIAQIGLTPNEVAANGPLPGDVSLYEKELRGCEGLSTPGYYPSLNSAEVGDAQRGALYPQATFGGSLTGPNVVYAHRSQDGYQGTTFISNRNPGELFLLGGDVPALRGRVAPGPYVAKVDATTGTQIWRTYLDNANISDRWIAYANLNILASGKLVVAWGDTIVLIDPASGRILKANSLPTGDTPIVDANFKHLTVAPEGTLILKNQNRPSGKTGQGSMGMIVGLAKGLKQTNSRYVAVDPNTLEVLDALDMPESAGAPHVITMFEGKIAIYASGDVHAYRYFWDPNTKKLAQDQSWVVSYLGKDQTTGACPGVMGDWIVIQTNGPVNKTTASSIVAINQKDPGRMTSVSPFGPLKPGQVSFAPPKSGTDPENAMVYSADVGMGKVAGIKLNQATGELKTVFAVANQTTSFQTLIGPKDQRVLIVSRMKTAMVHLPLLPTLLSGNYQEQVVWRDAATGRILAESDFFEPMALNGLLTPGYGGRVYFLTGKGFLVLQVKPKPLPPSSKQRPHHADKREMR
jgi:hypothetical protein